MRRAGRKLNTTFGTEISPINLEEGLFRLTKNAEVTLDTPLGDLIGTKKLFLKDTVVSGTLWKEADMSKRKSRKVVLVMEELQGRYLICQKDLEPTTQSQIDLGVAKGEVKDLGVKIEELLENAKTDSLLIAGNEKSFLDQKYAGFTGKQILVATVGVIILIKVFK